MIKKILIAVAVLLPMLASAQSFKMGVVDFNEILKVMPEVTEANAKVGDASKKYEAEFTKLQEEMQRLYDEYQKMDANEPTAIRERRARELADYDQKLQQFQQSAMQDLQRMQSELMAPVQDKLTKAVESVGKENGFSFVQMYDPQLTLYYAAPVEDITPLVKAKLGLR